MARFEHIFGAESSLLTGSLMRREQFGAVFYCPRLVTQLLINNDMADLISFHFIGKQSIVSQENAALWPKSVTESMLVSAFTAEYSQRIQETGSFPTANSVSLSAPVRLIIEVTARCNQQCRFCYAGDDEILGPEISVDEIVRLVDQCYEMGVFQIHLLGGEPLLREEIIDIIKYISSKGIYVSFTSNGILIDNYLSELADVKHLLPIQISLHSVSESVYEKYGISSKNIDLVIDNCKKLCQSGIKFGIKSVISQYNSTEMLLLARLAADLGAQSITFLNMIPSGRGKAIGEISDLKGQRIDRIMEDLRIAMELPLHVDYRSLVNIYFPREPSTTLEEYVECPSGHLDMRIRSDGMLIQCSAVRRKMMDIRGESLAHAWEDFHRLKLPCPYLECGVSFPCV